MLLLVVVVSVVLSFGVGGVVAVGDVVVRVVLGGSLLSVLGILIVLGILGADVVVVVVLFDC